MARLLVLWVVMLLSGACAPGPLAPGCARRTGPVIPDMAGLVAAGGVASYEVTSPVNSNLHVTLTWADADVQLGLQATILACGVHVGCQIGFTVAPFEPPPLLRRLTVDGSRGKRYRIDVAGDPARDQRLQLSVTYDTGTCT